jgi:predicted RecB family nuclease
VHRSGDTLVLSPSDLTAFLACEHRSALDRAVAEGRIDRPHRDDPDLEVLRRRGDEHERHELERLEAEGRTVVRIERTGESPEALLEAEAATVAAMRAGAEVIFQATFFDGRWRGQADFLVRVEEPSDLGRWSYEVADTKLARRAKPAALVQMASYAEHVARIQGRPPREVEVVTGDGERHRFRLDDIAAYHRAAKARLEAFVDAAESDGGYPHPVEHCSVCPWLDRCDARRRADDHLSLVAGMRRDMTVKLGRVGVTTLTALAGSPVGEPVPGMGQPTADRLRDQARLQLAQRVDGRIRYELLEAVEGHGLVAMPPPSKGDLFVDLEGDPWAGDGGIEYLWGVVDADGAYTAFWAHDAAAEKRAFEAFVDLVIERLDGDPTMHVYHYAPYEVSAVKRLMGRHATRGAEVDRLLRGEVFVDLYRVVRQGLRVSTEGYGLKKLEPLYLDARDGEITDGGSSIVAYEDWLETQDPALLEAIRAYNEVDCRSTLGLRDWLEARRAELGPVARPEVPDDAPSDAVVEADRVAEELAERLVSGLGSTADDRTDDGDARVLLAGLLGWHRREQKPEWWAWFDRQKRSDDELVNDHECLAELTYEGVVDDLGSSLVHRYSYDPVQEHKVSVGDKPVDPRTGSGAGTVVALDAGAGTVDLKRSTRSQAPHPTALVPARPFDNRSQREAVVRLARRVVDHPQGDPPRDRAMLDLLRHRPPRLLDVVPGEPLQRPGESGTDAALRLVPRLLGGCLAVQGPPGSGKTWTGAAVVVDAVRRRRRVGVTAQSHKAIGNLVDAVVRRAEAEGVDVRVIQKASDDDRCSSPDVRCTTDNAEVDHAVGNQEVDVVAGTSFLFARPELDGTLDLLVIDEAGQLSLANVAAVGGVATDLVLLGDPQQLAQVSRGAHPDGAGVSALEHVLRGSSTVDPTRGLFLEESHRMHPDICRFVSAIAYDDRLEADPACAVQAVGGEAGLRWLPVVHEGNRTRSDEEAEAVGGLVESLLGRPWTDRHGQQGWLTLDDVLVIAPYNAQVAVLSGLLPPGARVGTVDRFQGQEAPVVIYSTAASSADDVPRGLDFLLSINRLNVAVSRARALAVVVASPALLRAPVRTTHQLRLVNALCRFVERAERLG